MLETICASLAIIVATTLLAGIAIIVAYAVMSDKE